MTDKVLSKTLRIKNGRLLRNVENITSIKKLIDILTKKNYIGTKVINTKIYSEEDKLIEHEILRYIIHSGEYTESMAYDVNMFSLDMALDLLKEGIYSYDLLPHNFTFHNGQWFLYDFDSFQLKPEKIMTQIRGFFKIIFSNYEILKLIKREELGNYYLTRYRIEDILYIIPFYRWIYLFLNQALCSTFIFLKLYKIAYLYLKKLFIKYSRNKIKNYYNYLENKNHAALNEIITNNKITSIFCIGEEAADYAVYNEENSQMTTKVVYIDDYNLLDNYYNFIVVKGFKNIIPAVLYPLINDDEISKDLKYRALYDTYAQERFYSDAVLYLDKETDSSLIKNLSKFTKEILVLSKDKVTTDNIEFLKTIYNDLEFTENYIIAKNKLKKEHPQADKPYKDGNRGPDARRQSKKVKELIKNKNS